MAAATMTVTTGTDTAVVDITANANKILGTAGDPIYFANDGHTYLLMDCVTGDTATFTVNADVYSRTKTKTAVVAAGKIGIIGPFPPAVYNDVQGRVTFSLTSKNAGDVYLAVSVPQY
jgi:hypothetical protein